MVSALWQECRSHVLKPELWLLKSSTGLCSKTLGEEHFSGGTVLIISELTFSFLSLFLSLSHSLRVSSWLPFLDHLSGTTLKKEKKKVHILVLKVIMLIYLIWYSFVQQCHSLVRKPNSSSFRCQKDFLSLDVFILHLCTGFCLVFAINDDATCKLIVSFVCIWPLRVLIKRK